jgi:ribosomal biogenesis protein LAS1
MFRSLPAVAWRDWEEWKDTYRMLYSVQEKEILMGCSRVSAWAAKQPLPIAVEVTADLQRELHGTRNVLALSLAVIRFINGVVEPFKNANLAVPISTIGASYGIPDFVINIRHSATHGRLPSFELAALGAESALDWLRTNYWEAQVAELNNSENDMSQHLLSYLLDGGEPFKGFKPSVILSSGIKALLKLALNRSQSGRSVSLAFQQKVADLLRIMNGRLPHFASAFGLAIAEEVAKGDAVAACWLDFLAESGWLPLKSCRLILKWSGCEVPVEFLKIWEESKGNEGEEDEMIWPPTSLGYLPISNEALTLKEGEFRYVEPVRECQEVVSGTVADVNAQIVVIEDAKPEPENLVEIW